MADIIVFILATFLGGWLSRWHGGGMFKADKVIKNIAWAVPLTGAAIFMSGWWGLLGLACIAGKATGHGAGIDLGTWTQSRSDEKLEFIIKPLYGKIPEYWYDVLLLAVTGLAATLGAAIAISLTNPAAGLLCALGGALKPVGYMIGWAIWPDNRKSYATRTGEWGAGIFAYGLTAIGVLYA